MKRVEQAESLCENIIDNVSANIFLVRVEGDNHFVCERINKELEKKIGLKSEELEGKRLADVFGKEEAEKKKKGYLRCIREKKTLSFREQLSTKTGLRTVVTKLTPVEYGNKIVKIVGISTDITEIELTESKLKQNRKILESIIKTLPGMLLVIDKAYNIVYVNDNVLAVSNRRYENPDRVIGEKCYHVFGNGDSPCPWCGIHKINERDNLYVETTCPGDRREKYFKKAIKFCWTAIKDEQDETIGFIEYGVDITALRNAKLKAEAANKAKGEFLANMSHELRTPLNGIMGFAELLRGTKLDKSQKEFNDTIIYSAQNLLEIISDILDYSKLEADRLVMRPLKMSLRTMLDEIGRVMTLQAMDKGIEFLIEVSDECPDFIECDPMRLKQVLLNLVANAIKFTNEGSVKLSIKTEQINRETQEVAIYFAVEDTGIGIKKDDLAKVFDKFTQVDMSYSRKYGGTGLGLSISQQILKKMGSLIDVDSTFGKGSTFSFALMVSFYDDEAKFEYLA